MKMDVTFVESDQSFTPNFEEVINELDGGYNLGYAEGYEQGETVGKIKEQELLNKIISNSGRVSYTNDTVTNIRPYAFDRCHCITDVNFPKATIIGEYAFYNCTELTTLNFPEAINIGIYAFAYTNVLTNVNFPKVTTIDRCAFHSCQKLTTLDFPAVTSINSKAFGNCQRLTTLILRNRTTICKLNSTDVFANDYSLLSDEGGIYVPDELVNGYKTATDWLSYADYIKPISELKE